VHESEAIFFPLINAKAFSRKLNADAFFILKKA